MKFPIEGSCQCGQLTYKLFEKPTMVLACHCTECQKLSTSPFSVTAIIASTAIEFKGELKEWSRSSDSGNKNNAKFQKIIQGHYFCHSNQNKKDIKCE